MKKPKIFILAIILSSLCMQKITLPEENLMLSMPEWYRMLPEGFKPIEDDKMKSLENLRIKYRASHENLLYAILSTPWAVEKAQYNSLKQAKRMYPHLGEKDLWKVVLLSRFQTWKNTAGLEAHEFSKLPPEEIKSKIGKMEENIDLILSNFKSFTDIVKFAICLEDEMGNFIDPSGILDEISSILGRGRPSQEENMWYISVIKKIQEID